MLVWTGIPIAKARTFRIKLAIDERGGGDPVAPKKANATAAGRLFDATIGPFTGLLLHPPASHPDRQGEHSRIHEAVSLASPPRPFSSQCIHHPSPQTTVRRPKTATDCVTPAPTPTPPRDAGADTDAAAAVLHS